MSPCQYFWNNKRCPCLVNQLHRGLSLLHLLRERERECVFTSEQLLMHCASSLSSQCLVLISHSSNLIKYNHQVYRMWAVCTPVASGSNWPGSKVTLTSNSRSWRRDELQRKETHHAVWKGIPFRMVCKSSATDCKRRFKCPAITTSTEGMLNILYYILCVGIAKRPSVKYGCLLLFRHLHKNGSFICLFFF